MHENEFLESAPMMAPEGFNIPLGLFFSDFLKLPLLYKNQLNLQK
jgi:hypothetical protein